MFNVAIYTTWHTNCLLLSSISYRLEYFLFQIAKDVPRICFLSGLSGEEMMMFIDAFPETGTFTPLVQQQLLVLSCTSCLNTDPSLLNLCRPVSSHSACFFVSTGLDPAVFAAVVPNSADKPISELLEEIMGDHEMLVSYEQFLHFLRTFWYSWTHYFCESLMQLNHCRLENKRIQLEHCRSCKQDMAKELLRQRLTYLSAILFAFDFID